MTRIKPIHTFLGILVILFSVALFYLFYNNLTGSSTDLLPSWYGAKFYFEDGINPYSDPIGDASQALIYGRDARPDEDQMLFAYPFYTIFYLNVLAFVPYQVTAAVYMQLMLYGLLLALALHLNMTKWTPSPLMLALLVFFTIMGYFSIRGVMLAQLALLAYAFHIAALWGIHKQKDVLAGCLLALSTIKPQTGYLIVPLLLLWAWRFRRWGVIYGFVGLFGGLILISFILQPSWFADWFDRIEEYETYTETLATVEIVTHTLGLPSMVENGVQFFVMALLAIPVLLAVKTLLIDRNDQEMLWIYSLVMAFSLMVAPRTATPYYVELYPVLYVVAMIASKNRNSTWIYISGLALLIGYWALHVATVPPRGDGPGGAEAPIVYVIFPIIIWGLLFYYREYFPKGITS